MRIASIVSLVAIGAGAQLYLGYRRSINRALDRVASGSRLLRTSVGPIEYAERGSGPAVLVVHGSGGGFDQGMEFAEPLAQRGFRAVAPSRFGYLRTVLPADGSPEAQADAHAALLDALGISTAAVIGVSAGAPSAMQFALRFPHRCGALVLLVPMAFKPAEVPSSVPLLSHRAERLLMTLVGSDAVFWLASKLLPNLVIKTVLATPPALVRNTPSGERARVYRMMEFIMPISRRRSGLLNDARIAASLPRYDLATIKAPTLVVSARDDLYGTFAAAAYTASQIPGARFVGSESGGHLWVGHHAQLIATMTAFLAGTVGAAA
jgi:pimeloyl-ACP methyl ester carboxylesterase